MIRVVFLLCLVFLASCTSFMPTSRVLEQVRALRQMFLARELETHDFRLGQPVYFRIFKEENVLEVWLKANHSGQYALFKTYPICNFSGHLGPKLAEGDKQAPEGFYAIAPEQMNPNSGHHLAFNLGYPNAYDKAHGYTGSALMIHGGCASIGCYAMTDESVEQIYLIADNAMRHGQKTVPVHIFPFQMTPEKMAAHADSEWASFWQSLKIGYDLFEETKVPPIVRVDGISYHFFPAGPPVKMAEKTQSSFLGFSL